MRYFVIYCFIIFVTAISTVYSADQSSIWQKNVSLDNTINTLIKNNNIKYFEPIDIKNTRSNDLLILGKGNVSALFGYGESKKLVLFTYNLDNYKTNIRLIQPPDHSLNLSLVNNDHLLSFDTDGTSTIYKIEQGKLSIYLKELKKYDLQPIKITAEYPEHYWIGFKNKYALYKNNSEKEVENLEVDNKTKYNPQFATIEMPQINQKLFVDWTIKNKAIRILKQTNDREVTPYDYTPNTESDSLEKYVIVEMMPYSENTAIIFAQQNQKPIILEIRLSNKTYSTIPLKTPDNLLKLTLYRNTALVSFLYALIKDLRESKIIRAQLDDLIADASHQTALPQASTTSTTTTATTTAATSSPNISSPTKSPQKVRTKPKVARTTSAPAGSTDKNSTETNTLSVTAALRTKTSAFDNSRANALAYLKKNTPISLTYDVQEDPNISERLGFNQHFNEFGWDPKNNNLTNQEEHILQTKLTWQVDDRGRIVDDNKKPYFTSTKRKIAYLIPISPKQGFAHGEDGRVYHVTLVDIPNLNYGAAYFKELLNGVESLNAQKIMLMDEATGTIGIINQPFLDREDLEGLNIKVKSDSPKALSILTQKIVAKVPDLDTESLEPEFLVVAPPKIAPPLPKTELPRATNIPSAKEQTTANTLPVASSTQSTLANILAEQKQTTAITLPKVAPASITTPASTPEPSKKSWPEIAKLYVYRSLIFIINKTKSLFNTILALRGVFRY